MEIPSTEVQNNFGRYLKLAQFEEVIVTKNGKKAAVIKAFAEPGESNSIAAEKADDYDWQGERISYDDFLKLSQESEKRYEYIGGEVYLLASPSYVHQQIVMEISNRFYNWFKGKECRTLAAPFDITLIAGESKNVVQPDIMVICDLENVNESGYYTGTPTLVVEVLSDSTRQKDMLKKLNLYLYGGVKEYWIVSPQRKEIYVYSFAEQDILDYRVYKGNEAVQSVAFQTLEITLTQIFSY